MNAPDQYASCLLNLHAYAYMHTYICHFKCKWCMKKKNCRLTEKLCLSGGNSGTCKLQLPRTGLTKLNSISKPKSVQPKRPTRRMRNTNNRNLVAMTEKFFLLYFARLALYMYMCVCVIYFTLAKICRFELGICDMSLPLQLFL